MALRTGLLISVLFFGFGAIGTYNDFDSTYFNEPVQGGLISPKLFIYLSYIAGAMTSAYFLARIVGYSGNSYGILFVLPVAFLVVLTISFAFISNSRETNDLEKNGTVLITTIDRTTFKWVKGRGEQLYYSFSYRLSLNDSTYQFTQWRRITNHNFTSTRNPEVNYDMLSEHSLFHPGDTLKFRISKVNPWRHKLLAGPKPSSAGSEP
jgi:hypothetical protein